MTLQDKIVKANSLANEIFVGDTISYVFLFISTKYKDKYFYVGFMASNWEDERDHYRLPNISANSTVSLEIAMDRLLSKLNKLLVIA